MPREASEICQGLPRINAAGEHVTMIAMGGIADVAVLHGEADRGGHTLMTDVKMLAAHVAMLRPDFDVQFFEAADQ
jgi:hypothetical protein